MKLPKNSNVKGAWLDKKTLKTGDAIKIVSEATLEEGQKGQQLVARVLVRGGDKEAKNLGINQPSKAALIEAYGDETAEWINKVVTVSVERVVIGGKRQLATYLIPEGFELTEDSGGFLVVQRIGVAPEEVNQEPREDDFKVEDIPF